MVTNSIFVAFHSPLRLVVLGVCLLCGCELDRPSFQMNSNSPTPFFGIDLLPRRRTTSLTRPSELDRVASSERQPRRLEREGKATSVGWSVPRTTNPHRAGVRVIELPLQGGDAAMRIDRGPVELFP